MGSKALSNSDVRRAKSNFSPIRVNTSLADLYDLRAYNRLQISHFPSHEQFEN